MDISILKNESKLSQITADIINLGKEKTIIIDKGSKNSIESYSSISDMKNNNNNSSSTSVKFNLKMTEVDFGFDSRKSFNKDIIRKDIYLNFNFSPTTTMRPGV